MNALTRMFGIGGRPPEENSGEAADANVNTDERPGGATNANRAIVMLALAALAMTVYIAVVTVSSPPEIPEPSAPQATASSTTTEDDPFISGTPIFDENADVPDVALSLNTPMGVIGQSDDAEYVLQALAAPIHENVSSFPLPLEDDLPMAIPPNPQPATGNVPLPEQAPPNQQPGLSRIADALLQPEPEPEPEPVTRYLDPSTHLLPGAVVPAILSTEVNSDFTSGWIGQVTHPVFDHTVKNLLIPAGSIVTGNVLRYDGQNEIIRDSVILAAQTITRPDGAIIPVAVRANDTNGTGGIAGDTDSHFLSRSLGTAAFAVFSIIPSLTADNGPPQSARDEATGEITQEIGSQIQPLARRYAQIVPTTVLPPGTRMRLLIDRPIPIDPWSPARRPMRFGAL